jgi:hypothetical protein
MMNEDILRKVGDIYWQWHRADVDYYLLWKEHILFTWGWWLNVFLLIGPWVLWFLLRNKESVDRLLHAGLFIALISLVLDFAGSKLALWYYPVELIPTFLDIPWDLSLGPVMVMFFLQYKPNFSPVLKAITAALLISFVYEPTVVWLGLYYPIKWKYIYSVPVYIILYLLAHAIAKKNIGR